MNRSNTYFDIFEGPLSKEDEPHDITTEDKVEVEENAEDNPEDHVEDKQESEAKANTQLTAEPLKLPEPTPLDLDAAVYTAEKQRVRTVTSVAKHVGTIFAFCLAVCAYSVFGGLMFVELESRNDLQLCKLARAKYLSALTEGVNSVDNIRTDFTLTTQERYDAYKNALDVVREAFVNSTWKGQDCDNIVSNWNIFGATIWCLTVITSIGYGHIAPATSWGKLVCVVYALFGLPLTLMTLAKLGEFFSDIAQFSYHVVCCCAVCRKDRRLLTPQDKQTILREYFKTKYPNHFSISKDAAKDAPIYDPQRLAFYEMFGKDEVDEVNEIGIYEIDEEDMEFMSLNDLSHVPWLVSVCVIFLSVIAGGSIFSAMEDWSTIDAIYFSFITMATIGFGDLYPSIKDPLSSKTQFRFGVWGLFIFFGLAVMSMCLNMIQLDVGSKLKSMVSRCTKTKSARSADVAREKARTRAFDTSSSSSSDSSNEEAARYRALRRARHPFVPMDPAKLVQIQEQHTKNVIMDGLFNSAFYSGEGLSLCDDDELDLDDPFLIRQWKKKAESAKPQRQTSSGTNATPPMERQKIDYGDYDKIPVNDEGDSCDEDGGENNDDSKPHKSAEPHEAQTGDPSAKSSAGHTGTKRENSGGEHVEMRDVGESESGSYYSGSGSESEYSGESNVSGSNAPAEPGPRSAAHSGKRIGSGTTEKLGDE